MITFDVGAYEATLRDMYRSMTAEEILEDALKVLESGWTKGELANGEGHVCMLGALNKASNMATSAHEGPAARNVDAYCEARDILAEVAMAELKLRGVDTRRLRQIIGTPEAIIPTFNDANETTLEDVRLVFKRAIGEASSE
jgi:hypothetical protein